VSRKRSKNKRPGEAIPTEILAEGSGPNEVVEANPHSLAQAAEELVEKRKSKKRKGREEPEVQASAGDEDAAEPIQAATDETEPADAGEAALDAAPEQDVAAEAETSPRRGRGKRKAGTRGRRDADAPVEDEVQAADAEATESSDVEATDEHQVALDAAGGNEPSGDDVADADAEAAVVAASDEAAIEGAVEDAVLRAEAEAELNAAADAAAAEGGEAGDEEGGAALPTTAATMGDEQLKHLVEALVFAADKPITVQRLRQLTRVGDVRRLEQALSQLAVEYAARGIALQVVSGGYQFRTNTSYSVWVQQLIAGRPVRLSRAQLETLAIVAYRQPITRPEIDEIRGVDSSATLRLLLDRSLIRTLGKKEDVGRPMLYGTTKEFLDFFSLNELRELPTLREYSELTAESRKVMSDRLGVDPDGELTDDGGGEGESAPSEADAAADAEAAAAAVRAVDATAHDVSTVGGVEVDVWGQVLTPAEDDPPSIPPATDDELAVSETNRSDASVDTDAFDSDELSTASDNEVSASESSEDEPSVSTDELSAARDEDLLTVESTAAVDAWGQPISVASDDEVAAATDGEVSTSESGHELGADDEAVSAAADEASASESSDDGAAGADEDVSTLGAPAGASMEERMNLAPHSVSEFEEGADAAEPDEAAEPDADLAATASDDDADPDAKSEPSAD
jgi:segregation and condensation protein B